MTDEQIANLVNRIRRLMAGWEVDLCRDVRATDMKLDYYEHGLSWALAESLASTDGAEHWTTGDIARAFEAGAKAAEAKERERCAKVADAIGAGECAAAIRALPIVEGER
jgi:hypothetical protein